MTPWELEAVELVACNCAYGCPCQFNALPTHGNCEAMAGFKINRGHFGDTLLPRAAQRHPDRLTADAAGFFRGKKRDHFGHFLGACNAARRV